MLALAKENICQAMDRAYADKNRSFKEFEEGEKVFLKIPSSSTSLSVGQCIKVSPRYYGPWLILKRIGKVAYKLELPQGCRVHLMFHVSCLKKFLHLSDSLIEDIVLFQEIRGQCKAQTNKNPGPRNDASSESEDTHCVGCMAWSASITSYRGIHKILRAFPEFIVEGADV